jgi:hypothetical protein
MAEATLDLNADFKNPITKATSRVELDVINYANAAFGASATASSQLSGSYPIASVIDGDRTHRNWGGVARNGVTKYGGWQSNGTGTESITIDFGVARKINRVEIFFFPNGNKTNPSEDQEGAATIAYYFQLEGSSDWVAWSGLSLYEDVASGATCTAGVVEGNTKSHIVVQDLVGVYDVRKIKVEFQAPITEGVKYKVCEIEVYRTEDISDLINTISINRRKDVNFNRYVMGQLNLSLFNYDKRFSPEYVPSSKDWYDGNYKRRVEFRVDHSKIEEDLTDLPVLVNLTSSNFKFNKAKSDGSDVIFVASDGSTILSFERVSHDATNKKAEYWVKLPEVSSTTDTIFYLYYSNPYGTDKEDKNATWNSDYLSVWHLNENGNGTAEEFKDSTSNDKHLSVRNASFKTNIINAKVGSGQRFTARDCLKLDPYVIASENFTVSIWVKIVHDIGGEDYPFLIGNFESGQCLMVKRDWKNIEIYSCGSQHGSTIGSDGVFKRVSMSVSGSDLRSVVDGLLHANSSIGNIDTSVGNIQIGDAEFYQDPIDPSVFYDIDEVRISTVARSEAYEKASYHAENNSLLFYLEEGLPLENQMYNLDINPDMRFRLFVGLDNKGFKKYVSAGHFYMSTWKVSSKKQMVQVSAKDRIKHISLKKVETESSVLSGKYIEWLLEYIFMQGNISADEMDLDDTLTETQYYFPDPNETIWEQAQKLSEAVADITLFVNKYGTIEYHCFLDTIPHEWMQQTQTEFEAGSITNLASRALQDTLKLPVAMTSGSFQPYESYSNLTFGGSNISIQHTKFQSMETCDTVIRTLSTTLTESAWHYHETINVSGSHIISKIYLRLASYNEVYLSGVNVYFEINGTTYSFMNYLYTGNNYNTGLWREFQIPRVNSNGQPINLTVEYIYGDRGTITRVIGHDSKIAYMMYESPTSGYVISKEYDTGCLENMYSWTAFARSQTADGCTITYTIGTYDTSGTAWASIPGGQKQTITNGATPTIAKKRFTRIRVDINAAGSGGTPVVSSYSQGFTTTGKFISQAKDLGGAPTSWGLFNPIDIKPSGTSITYYTQTSTDGLTWDDEAAVDGSWHITSALKRYIRWVAYFATNNNTVTPTLDTVTIYYNSGGGSVKSFLSFNLRYDDTLLDFGHSLSDEYGGSNQLYTRVTVKTSPYYLQTTQKIWEAQVPFSVSNGVAVVFNCELPDPCDTGTNMKLHINSNVCTGGSQSFGDMDVVFTKQPRLLIISITPKYSGDVTAMYIDAQPYRVTGVIQSVSESAAALKARYGDRDFVYENEYIYVKATAALIAGNIRETYETPKLILDNGITTQFCPMVDIGSLVVITEKNTGVDGTFEVIGYTHTITSTGARTSIQAQKYSI